MHSESPTPSLSVVVISHNEGPHLRSTVESLQGTLPDGAEIVVVDDGSTDGSTDFLANGQRGVVVLRPEQPLGVARARNAGARAARGQVVAFSDAHVETPPGWWRPLVAHLAHPHVGAVAPAVSDMANPLAVGYGQKVRGPDLGVEWLELQDPTPHAVPFVGGGFLAMRRSTWEATGGFDAGMAGWGWEDLELSLRLWLLGYAVDVVPEATVAHLFRERHPYQVDWAPVLRNMLRLVFVHFSPARIARVLEAYLNNPALAQALAESVDTDIWARRAELAQRRVRDDDWFFDTFSMEV